MTAEEKAKWFDLAIRFSLDKNIHLVMKSRTGGEGHWAIVDTAKGLVMNSNLEWEEEPPVQKRDEGFLIRTRFAFEQATELFNMYKMYA